MVEPADGGASVGETVAMLLDQSRPHAEHGQMIFCELHGATLRSQLSGQGRRRALNARRAVRKM